MFLLNILRKLNFKQIAIGLLIAISVFSYSQFKKIKKQKQLIIYNKENYRNLRDLDSLKTAHLIFTNKQQVSDYINTENGLKSLIEKQKTKIRKITSIVYIKQKYIDSLKNTHDVTTIVKYIRENKPFIKSWRDSTSCLTISGNISYANDSLKVNVLQRKFDNEIAVIGTYERNQWKFLGIKTRLFGRKRAIVKVSTKCGGTKTVVIDRK